MTKILDFCPPGLNDGIGDDGNVRRLVLSPIREPVSRAKAEALAALRRRADHMLGILRTQEASLRETRKEYACIMERIAILTRDDGGPDAA